uniref:S1 motif domain-containing protein n=1 Tax=Glossina brevipalpis TaxID=37001 RepID=A0A1A9WLS2_9MUSC
MVIVEKSFPRGGTSNVAKKETKENIIFGAVQRSTKKRKSSAHGIIGADKIDDNLETFSAELLNYDTIQEGMLIMGIVKQIDQLHLKLSLPGRITAEVSALEISNAYTKSLERLLNSSKQTDDDDGIKSLSDLYRIGQVVYGKVQGLERNDSGRVWVTMTLKPSDVHSELNHGNIRKNFLFSGAIEEIQEHGYIIESGIKNLRCFVPFEDLQQQQQQQHVIGQHLLLKVKKMTSDKTASTCICKEVLIDEAKIKEHSDCNLDYFMPSTIVDFQINKILKDGLQGTIMNELFTAYVNEHQLNDSLALPENFQKGSVYKAHILYVMPLTKLVYLTLNIRNLSEESVIASEAEMLKRGDIVENARVHHFGTGGVILILNEKFKGIISYKTMKTNYKGNYDQDALLVKYAKKSQHKVRILEYDAMDSLYICTDDANLVNEKYFRLQDVEAGEFVKAIVESQNPKFGGYNLRLGKLKGIIEKIYLAATSKTLDIDTKLKCRVVGVNSERNVIYLTNRPEYMIKNCKLLTSLDQAKINKTYMGTIVKIVKGISVLVKFFGEIKGVLYKDKDTSADEINNLAEGQTMLFRVVKMKGEQLILGLVSNLLLNPGEICPVKATHILESGLEVQVAYNAEDGSECTAKGIAPITFLSDFRDLTLAKLQTYNIDEELQVACLSGSTFSVRDVNYFSQSTINKWQDIKPGDILKAYIKNVIDENIIEIILLTAGCKAPIRLHSDMLLVKAFNLHKLTLSSEQTLYVRVLGKENVTKTISVSAKLTDVLEDFLHETAKYLESYLKEVCGIKTAFMKKGRPISQYSVGDKVTAEFRVVNDTTKDWEFVLDKTDVIGLVKATSVNKATKVPKFGTRHDCIILWIDYSSNVVYLSNKQADLIHISNDPNIPSNLIGKSGIKAKVLLKMDTILICSLKKINNPLIYCPARLHFNDFEDVCANSVAEGDFCRLSFIHDTLPIAVPENIYKVWHAKAKKRKLIQDDVKTMALKTARIEKLSNMNETALSKKKLKKQIESDNDHYRMEVNEKVKKIPKYEKLSKENDKQINQQQMTNKVCKKRKSAEEERVISKNGSSTAESKKEIKKQTLNNVCPQTKDDDKEVVNKKRPKNGKDTKEGGKKMKKDEPLFYEDKQPSVCDHFSETRLGGDDTQGKEAKGKKTLTTNIKPLAGVVDFWNMSMNDNSIKSSDTEDDDDDGGNDDNTKPIKKKKLTAAEKFKKQREEEARLRSIEEKYADPNRIPETIDQFDRLVLTEPDNSKHWINYMVFHMQSFEIEKSRAVARRALKTITFRNPDEQINIWVALLNLELRYGSKESFDDTFKEALTYNEPIKIYLRVLDILIDMQKQEELTDLISIVTKKFKSIPEAWRSAANALFTIGMIERAQQLLHKALNSLPEREHVNTIVMFANLNHKHGQNEMAQTLLDQVITSYPKRVDVWSQYVDMLVKENLIDCARNVLERAIIQKIPLKKMRIVFKKYLEFEQNHGTDANVQRVKQLAIDYVNKNQHL